jgi:ATP-dependent Lhr-like helicase
VSSIERLDPLVQHHIVNTLGWRELRDLQELSIEPILQGHHCLLIAPTAGGKTEAAMLPVLSRICSENWAPLSVLYVCPLKALLNNLAIRLDKYTTMVGRKSALWHGDVPAHQRSKIRLEPPDILLTTPESLEVILVSTQPEGRELLKSVRVVVVDELHAFGTDDRGWHLLAVVERICRLAGREIQRIGLSATVGNPDQLLAWLAAHCEGQRSVIRPRTMTTAEADVQIDFVGSVSNAAVVIARLHRGEKRLVFCDSRSQVEELAGLLRNLKIQTYVSHSSLSVEDRRAAETAFAEATDCVIVATSTLELGIDVGDLDRVIQIDAPNTVASFLQRLGRTGRRPGLARNCLFLATSPNALLRACAIVQLWHDGFVEPVEAPPQPLHVLVQQLMALALQLNGLGVRDWRRWLGRLPPFAALGDGEFHLILGHLVEQKFLYSDGVRLSLGDQAQEQFGRRHFMELLSVFTTSPLMTVYHGPKELGQVDQVSLLRREPDEPVVLSLGGRSWRVASIDWKGRQVFVEAADTPGRSSWLGTRRGISYAVARAVHRLLTSDTAPNVWSDRAREQMTIIRHQNYFLKPDADVILAEAPAARFVWHTLAGHALNMVLAQALDVAGMETVSCDDFSITLNFSGESTRLENTIRRLNPATARDQFTPSAQLAESLKFSKCLPAGLITEILRNRLVNTSHLEETLRRPRQFVSGASDRGAGAARTETGA